jgi:hypothetical protein
MFKRLLACGLLVVSFVAHGREADQEKPKGGLAFVDEVKVTVVNIDVFIRDRKGNAVTGLTKVGFRLLQDGRERHLSHFAAYTDEVMQPHVDVMVISVQRSPKIVQPFTNDPQVVKNALRSLTKVYGARTDTDRLRGRIIHDMQAAVDDAPDEGLRGDPRAAQDLQ